MLPGQDFVEDDAKRKNVGPAVRSLLQQYFRRHIGGRAGKGASAVHGRTLVGTRQVLGHAEVQYFDLALAAEHDVFRLDVTVNDAMPVRRHQGFRTLNRDGEKLIQRQRLPQPLSQVLAFHIFQDQEYLALLLQHVIDSGYVSIAEAGSALRFFEEAVAIKRVSTQGGGQALEGNGALEFGVFGAVNLTHASFAEPFSNAKASHHLAGQGILRLCRTRERGLRLRHKALHNSEWRTASRGFRDSSAGPPLRNLTPGLEGGQS